MESTYIPVVLPLLAKSTRERSKSVIALYLKPAFGSLPLRDLTPLTVQRFLIGMATLHFPTSR